MKATPRNPARRELLRRIVLAGGVSVAGAWGHAGLWTPNHPVVESITVAVPSLPPVFDGVRVGFVSDLHLQPAFGAERLDPMLALLGAAKPDVILLGGDYCNAQLPNREIWLETCANALRSLSAPLGVFAIFGNHDYPVPPFDPPRRPWLDAGITPLHDEAVPVDRAGERIFLVGLRSALSRGNRIADVVKPLPRRVPRLILQHEPSYIPQNALHGEGALMLSGHTHGGQIVLPVIGAPFLPMQSHLYRAGIYNRESRTMPLYVSRGVGLLPPLLRVGCDPEVTILTLRRGEI